MRHVISQAATGYIDPATGHMQPHGQGQVYHEPHHLHHQVSEQLWCQGQQKHQQQQQQQFLFLINFWICGGRLTWLRLFERLITLST